MSRSDAIGRPVLRIELDVDRCHTQTVTAVSNVKASQDASGSRRQSRLGGCAGYAAVVWLERLTGQGPIRNLLFTPLPNAWPARRKTAAPACRLARSGSERGCEPAPAGSHRRRPSRWALTPLAAGLPSLLAGGSGRRRTAPPDAPGVADERQRLLGLRLRWRFGGPPSRPARHRPLKPRPRGDHAATTPPRTARRKKSRAAHFRSAGSSWRRLAMEG